jgi:hypothetical protein
VTDEFCVPAIKAGLEACDLGHCPLVALPTAEQARAMRDVEYWQHVDDRKGIAQPLTHLLAIERVGPSHGDSRCYTMRGRDITELMSPAHRLFEFAHRKGDVATIGIGDGGNEIGMGKIPRQVIARNIPNGELVACRVPTQNLIVCGVSNWGAYALAAGLICLQKARICSLLFDAERERKLLEIMVENGPLVDGVTGKQTATVDGLTWEQYAEVLEKMKPLAA